jgi:hypothetical protein
MRKKSTIPLKSTEVSILLNVRSPNLFKFRLELLESVCDHKIIRKEIKDVNRAIRKEIQVIMV